MPNKNTIRYLSRIRKRISLYFVISMVFLLCVPLLLFLSLSDSGRKLSAQIMRSADAEDYMIPALSYPFSVHFIDVGCGDCILIMQDDTVILADCGSFSADGRVSKYLKKLGVDHIDLFAATHTDSDHIGDFEDIARNFSIGKIWLHDFCRKSYESCSADEKIFYDTIKEIDWTTGACMCVRTRVYKESGGLDAAFFAHMEEIDLCWRMRNKGWKLACVPQSVVYHLGGGSLAYDNPRKTYLNFRNNLLMIYKNHPCRRTVLTLRFFLDYIAALMFLLIGRHGSAKAICSARRDYKQMRSAYKS